MKINKDSWHYKLWRKSFNYSETIPTETDLCRYCHRVFWQVVGIAMIIFTIGVVLALLGLILYKGFWLNTGTAFAVTGIAALVIGAIYLYNRWLNGSPKPKQEPTLASSWMQARKENVCPLVEFEE